EDRVSGVSSKQEIREPMTEYRVTVGKEMLVFAAGQFITHGNGACESLHGHNYRVGVTLSGDLDHHSLVYDFIALKRDMESLLSELDHRTLLPTLNPELDVTMVTGGEVEARHATSRYVFPESDVVLLPIPNTTAERLAEYLCGRLVHNLSQAGSDRIHRVQIEVEETPGQSAFFVRVLGDS
ncbi:MAG: 6-pyruvoyl tetrahydropterin synthase family protein, partial [Gemmatimonadota bacterium]